MPKNSLPSVTSDIPKDLRYFIDRVAEVLTSNGPNQFLTLQDLRDGNYNDALDESGGTGSGPDDDDVIIPVFTPPKPTGLLATGGYEYIILEWDRPTYYGHAFTTVYRAPGLNANFSEAQSITSVEGKAGVFSDYLGTNQSATYWVQFTNINDVEGPISDPASASTAIDVEEVLDVLTGELTSTQFVDYLTTYLDTAPSNYVVKLSGDDGAAAGFGLAQVPRNDGLEFDFAIVADNFFMLPPVDVVKQIAPATGTEGQVWRKPPADWSPAIYYVWNGSTWVQQASEPAQTPSYFQFETPPAGSPVGTVWRKSSNKGTGPSEYYVWKDGQGWVEINPSPFIVRTTDGTFTNELGEEVAVPAGVYIRDGYILNGTITNAKIGTAAIDNAKIVNATITDAKIGFLDAGKIQTGEFQSFDFSNEEGKAGFRLAMGIRLVEGPNGEFLTNQEDVEFILRGALDSAPALQLINGVVTINALNIRKTLQSFEYSTSGPGFQFDIDNASFILRGANGAVLLASGGLDGTVIEDAIANNIALLQADIDANESAAETQFTNILNTINDPTSGLASKAPQTALETTNTNLDTLNTNLDSVRDPDTGFLDPEKISVNIINNDAQLLSDLEFLRPFAEEAELELFFNRAAFAQLIAGTLITDQAFVNTGNFDTVLTDTVLANNGTIDNLLVNTISIAGNAVTVPVSGNVFPGVGLTTSWTTVATTSTITWPNGDSRPSAAIVTATMNFIALKTDDPGTACRLRIVGVGPFNSNVLQEAAVSTRRDYSQVVTVSVKHDLSDKSSPYRYRLQARTDTSGDYQTGSGNIFALASKR